MYTMLRLLISKMAPFIIFLALIIIAIPRTIPLINRLIFFIYSIFVFWIFQNAINTERIHTTNNKKSDIVWKIILFFSVIFILMSRIILFMRFGEVPLGYDTGFYIKYFNDVPAWTTIGTHDIHKVPLYLFWIPFSYLGLSTITIFNISQVLAQLLIAGSLYTLVRSVYHTNKFPLAVVAVFIFAVSLTQFFAFWWVFSKQAFAIAFLLMTLALYFKRSPLAIITGGFGAAMHLPTFFAFGVAFFVFFLIQTSHALLLKRQLTREILITLTIGLLMIISAVFWSKNDILLYLNRLLPYRGIVSNFPSIEIEQAKGLFIDFETFRMASLLLLPFALLGIFFLRKHKNTGDATNKEHWLLLNLLFFILLALVTFPFVYQHRFLIHFEFFLILFAAYPLFLFTKYFLHNRLGQILLILLFLGFTGNALYVVWKQEPQLFPKERKEIESIKLIAESSSYAMATDPLYTPWVWAFSGIPTLAPGYLAWDRWDYGMWQTFWSGESDTRRIDLLSIYQAPIYLFIGQRQNQDMPFQKFIHNDSHFSQISPQIWKYTPNNL